MMRRAIFDEIVRFVLVIAYCVDERILPGDIERRQEFIQIDAADFCLSREIKVICNSKGYLGQLRELGIRDEAHRVRGYSGQLSREFQVVCRGAFLVEG